MPDYSEALEGARQQQPSSVADTMKTARNLAKASTPMGFFMLFKKVDMLKDMPFFCAFGFALFKDIFIDLIGLIPGVGTALAILFSFLCSIFIFMMLLLAGANGKGRLAKGLMKKGGAIIGGCTIDMIPYLGILPASTASVAVVYLMTLAERE